MTALSIPAAVVGLVLAGAGPLASAADSPPLVLEAKIPLGAVRGRIDHMAFDASRQYVYVAELGNDTVAVVDLKQQRLVRTIDGLHEPQGVGYVPSTDTIYVANARDGTVRLFRGTDAAPIGAIALGEDADNVRVDETAHRVFVGYGSGAIAVIDADTQTKATEIHLKAHPEGFQLEGTGQRIFINVPDANEIVIVDRTKTRELMSWPTGDLRANFPLAIDEQRHRVLVVFRHPAKLGVFDDQTGHLVTAADTCQDSDDVFVDVKRGRTYISCGEGFVDVLEVRGTRYTELGRVTTSGGARTALYAPTIDRLVVAVRATDANPAALWVYRPVP